jgi:hypothetical protein
MIVITSAHRQAGITGQENLACETFTTFATYRGKGLFCFSSNHPAIGEVK